MSVVMRMLARRVFVLSLAVVALFVVLASFAGPSRAEQLVASWYGVGDGFAGLTTANGETFDPYAYTAAHKTLPFDTKLKVTYQGESVVVRINDRGPYIEGRDLDLSYIAARDIGLVSAGSAPVEVEYVDASTPVGPAQTNAASPEPAPEPEPTPEPEPEPVEGSSQQVAQEPDAAPQDDSVEGSSGENAGDAQYAIEDQVSGDQYVDAEQYADEQDAAADQYEAPVAGESVTQPSGDPAPADEFVPEQAESELDEAVEQPSPATVAPSVEELEEPPEELVDPGSTVEHRVELNIAAAPGTATDSPDTPDPAPAPADMQTEDVLVSGEAAGTPDESEAEQPTQEETTPQSAEAPEEQLPGEDDELQEVDIEVLPDTGGPAKLPGVSLADLVAVLLVATLLRSGIRRLRA